MHRSTENVKLDRDIRKSYLKNWLQERRSLWLILMFPDIFNLFLIEEIFFPQEKKRSHYSSEIRLLTLNTNNKSHRLKYKHFTANLRLDTINYATWLETICQKIKLKNSAEPVAFDPTESIIAFWRLTEKFIEGQNLCQNEKTSETSFF